MMTISRTFITGDTHRFKHFKHLFDLVHKWEDSFSEKDVIIICGDAGLTWENNPCENLACILEYAKLGCTIVIVDGNHENFETLYRYPQVQKFGGPTFKIASNIYYLHRGYVYTINDQTFFAFGGAHSEDILIRVSGIDWWSQEIPNLEEMRRGMDNLNYYNNKIDFIITHTCGYNDMELLEDALEKCFYKDPETPDHFLKMYIDEIKTLCTFQRHFCGHFHEDEVVDKKTTFLFQAYYDITNYP